MEIQSFQNNGNHQEQEGQIRCCKKAFKKKKDSGGKKNGHMKSSHLMPAQQTMIFSY